MIRGSVLGFQFFSVVMFASYFPCADCEFGSIYYAPEQFVETYNYNSPYSSYSPYYPVEYAQGYAPTVYPTYAPQNSIAPAPNVSSGKHSRQKRRARKIKRKILSHSNDAHPAKICEIFLNCP